MSVNNKLSKSTRDLVFPMPRRPLVLRPDFWLVLAFILLGLLGAVREGQDRQEGPEARPGAAEETAQARPQTSGQTL